MTMDPESCICNFVDKGSVESHRYYLARRTVFEMLRDRGYNIPAAELELTLPEFRAHHGDIIDLEHLRISASLISDPSKKILVIFFGDVVIKLSVIRSIFQNQVHGQNLSRMILVLQGKMTSQAKKETQQMPFKVELFQITDLLINITKHVLKPRHHILTPQEKQKLLAKFSVKDEQLPCMLESDAIARYYGLEKEQVVKVTYSGEVTGSHVTYRCVV